MCPDRFLQAFYAWSSVRLYARKDAQIAKYIITHFCGRYVAVELLNCDRYLKPVFEPNSKLLSSPLKNIMVPTSFETINFLDSRSVVICSVKS